ncbi:MAG: UDP-N-acetylglucosamine--N-acetylmuramyl-(pentapeptide) pyrophosphoryl-undecaprenol N-acetylglucosamine transferase [Planctomycetota bacterium]|nr:UDP-N-acetylglucosamine--N-acetylmuramyl-(pentapeptide) pyrophosphoryl-undecaprenol N-acetylglucosamine transferase [Planctomycetota bacterium]
MTGQADVRPGGSDGPIYLFAGGGTGGHLYPALAVAGELVRRQPAARVVFACSNRPIDRHILDAQPYGVVPQPVRPIPRGPRGWWGFWRAWRESRRLARDLIADLNPRAVLGLGGFAAGPLVHQAARADIATALLNPDAVPGRANRFLARRVDVIFAQYRSTIERFPSSLAGKVRAVGCPVRAELRNVSREAAMAFFALDGARRTLVINGGSQGAATINQAALLLADDLAPLAGSWQVLHITGKGWSAPPAPARAGGIAVRRVEYCDRMDLAYAAADLLLGRAGASTTAELAATGTPAVLMPYPYHKDQHQRLNARSMIEMAAPGESAPAIICEDHKDAGLNAATLRALLLPLLADSVALAQMRRSAQTLPGADAAAVVAQWLVDAGGGAG